MQVSASGRKPHFKSSIFSRIERLLSVKSDVRVKVSKPCSENIRTLPRKLKLGQYRLD